MRSFSSATIVLIGVWLTAVVVGLFTLMNYEYKPGIPGTPPSGWPVNSKIKLSDKQATLVMVVHPHCTCSRASIEELSQLMAHEQGKLAAYVLFWDPKDMPANWQKTDLWRSAAAIPGVNVLTDEEGAQANQFRAITSGQTMVYSRGGRLLFSGGITLARGHIGDNAGLDAVESILSKEPFQQQNSLVFGCSLLTPASKIGAATW